MTGEPDALARACQLWLAPPCQQFAPSQQPVVQTRPTGLSASAERLHVLAELLEPYPLAPNPLELDLLELYLLQICVVRGGGHA